MLLLLKRIGGRNEMNTPAAYRPERFMQCVEDMIRADHVAKAVAAQIRPQ